MPVDHFSKKNSLPPRMKNSSARLVNFLIGKALAETVLVGVVAVGFYLTAFPPTFHGWGENLSASRSIAGWAVNDADPAERVEVQLFVDDKFVGAQVASLPRPDVRDAGWARDEWCGYNFQVSGLAKGSHFARVYAVHQSGEGARFTLQLLGNPIPFGVNDDGTWWITPIKK